MKHELSLAHDVQARLLPENPTGVSGAGVCWLLPAGAVDWAGDYYDLLPLRDGSFGVTLGDVSGKGIPAAVMMASIQTLLRSLLQREAGNPRAWTQMMQDLNETLYTSFDGGAVLDAVLRCDLAGPERS